MTLLKTTDCYFSVVLGEWFGFAAFAVGGCHCAEEVSWSGYLFERYLVQGESRSLSARTGLFVLNVLAFHKVDVGLWSNAVVFPISPLRSFTKFIFALAPPPPHHLPAFWQFYISHNLIKYDGRLNLRGMEVTPCLIIGAWYTYDSGSPPTWMPVRFVRNTWNSNSLPGVKMMPNYIMDPVGRMALTGRNVKLRKLIF